LPIEIRQSLLSRFGKRWVRGWREIAWSRGHTVVKQLLDVANLSVANYTFRVPVGAPRQQYGTEDNTTDI